VSLSKVYQRGGRVSGMIFLHRITDPRMSGSALKTLEIFKLLTGTAAMSIVRLVTTRWNEMDLMGPDQEKANRLEDQLRTTDKFWGAMIRAGAISLRHDNGKKSAEAVILSLSGRTDPPPKLAIVKEILDESRSLLDTAAGSFIDRDNDELRKQFEKEVEKLKQERQQALVDQDHELAEVLAAQEQEYLRRTETMLDTKSQLDVTFDRLQQQVSQRSLSQSEGRSASSDENSAALRSENQLLHSERLYLEDQLEKAKRQRRIEVARMEQAMAQQTEQERTQSRARLDQVVRQSEIEHERLRDRLERLKRTNRRLRRNRHSFFDMLMGI
jgi:hypothetical protein